MRCERAKIVGILDCEVCDLNQGCQITKFYVDHLPEMTLGKTKISPNHQIALIKEVRPWLNAQPGQHVQYRKLNCGIIVLEKVQE